MSDNNVTIVGNVTRDVELSFTKTGLAIATFGVAVNRRWQKDGEWEEKVSFVDVVCWGKLGENVSDSLGKGDRVLINGRFDQQTWEDKETGKNRSKIELVAEAVGPDLRWATAQVERNPKEGPNASREPDFAEPSSSKPRAGKAAVGPDEEPFVVPAGEWWPEAGVGPVWPERLLGG